VEKKFLHALIISVFLHIVLVVVLFVGDFTPETKPIKNTAMAQEVKPIQATVIDSAKLQTAINKIKKQKADDKAA
jgi:membrane protein involved in colicin uptake